VKRFSLHFTVPLILTLVVMTGCGSSSTGANKGTTPTANPVASAIATPRIPPTATVSGGTTAAVVNGVKIPMSSFRTILTLLQRESVSQPGITTKALAKRTMDIIVTNEVVHQYAAGHNLAATDAAINAQIAAAEKQAGGLAAFNKRLAQVGLTLESFKPLVRSGIEQHNVASRVTPLQAAHVRHILVATSKHKPPRTDAAARTLANTLFGQIQHGGNFAALARKYSDDTGSGKQGGDLGTFCVGVGLMVPEFDRASATLPPNHPQIVHTTFGYHIIEVLSRGPAAPNQCAQGAQQGAPPARAENTLAFQTWVKARVKRAHVQRIAQAA
jgi:parvulin-like peptidyl-prolyl isomerase